MQFTKWTEEGVYFVCRLKDNALYEVQDVLFEKKLTEEEFGVMKAEHIHLKYKENREIKTLCLKKVTYKDKKKRIFTFITNNFTITAEEVAFLYKKQWNIELLFKKLKQNFTQLIIIIFKVFVRASLFIYIMLSKTQKAFSTVAALVRIFLISHLDINWMVTNCRRTYVQKKIKKPPAIQQFLF